MKKLLILVIVLAVIYLVVKLSVGSPDQAIPEATNQENVSDTSNTEANTPTNNDTVQEEKISADRISIAFTGYGPGKKHDGTVAVGASTLSKTGNVFKGGLTIDMNSIVSSPDLLVNDLKSGRFFDVSKYPTASFMITDSSYSQVKGSLTIKGVTQSVALPVTFDSATSTYNSTVRIDMELFGIKQALADKEFVVRISIK